jgi:outer membrane receptor protein involved in Fe transport
MKHLRTLEIISVSFSLFALAAPAFAQDIVVTAERRAQDAARIPAAAAALSEEELSFIAPQAVSEALNRLPGVAIHRNNGVENLPAIRSPVLTGGQSAGSFLVLEDGVPIRAPGFANVNQLFETSLDFARRVEVTRGPGSALYGSNAVHGIVNVLTRAPGAAIDHAGDVRVDADFAGGYGGAVAYGWGQREGAVDDRVVSRIGFSARHEDGPRAASGLDQQTALFGVDAYAGAWTIDARLFAQNLNQETASFIEGTNAYDNSALAQTNPTPEAYRDTQIVRARAALSRPIGVRGRLVVTPYARWIDADLNLSFFPSRAQEISRQKGGGVQTALYLDASEVLSLIVGADGDVTRGSLYEFQSRPTTTTYVQGLHYDYVVDMRVLAAFAQARWTFAPDWSATAGLRGEWVRYEYDNRAPANDVGRFRRPADRTDDFDAVTPKLGVVWTPAPSQAVWVNLARGARPPQITDLYSLQTTQTPGAQGVETIDSAELGWRGDLGPARLELALYAMEKRDTSFRNADGFTVTNGASRHRGVELSGRLPLSESIAASGWITYAAHTYRFDNPSTRGGESIRRGDDVDGAPRWLWNARLDWTPRASPRVELEWVHVGEYFTNAENTRRYTGHDVFNLRGEGRLAEALWISAAVRNLTNTDYAERADFAFGNDRYFPGEGRTLTLGLRANF